MRGVILALTSSVLVLSGATCLPLTDDTRRTPIQGTNLAISMEAPAGSTSVPEGRIVRIDWSVGNRTNLIALVSLEVESRRDLSRRTLVADLEVPGRTGFGTFEWDTTGFSDSYIIWGRVVAGTLSAEDRAAGIVTIDAPATFRFTAPTEDATFELGGPTLRIAWNAGNDDGGAAQILLDPDDDRDNGNEILIRRIDDLPNPAEDDDFEWNGTQVEGGTAVAAGTYTLFARVTDEPLDELVVESVRITVVEPVRFGVVQPEEDVSFLTTDDPLAVEFTINQSSDVLIDLKVDTDDNHANGNEITTLSQRLIDADTERDTFVWNGNDSSGNPLGPGIYRIHAVLFANGQPPRTEDAPGLVFRRTAANQPLIGLLEPAAVQRVTAGSFVTIRWRDDDPDENATIRITIDDDPRPNENEPGSADDLAEIEILSGRSAAGDGVQDTFTWQVPGSLPPGTYYIFAYISNNDFEQVSVAPATVIIRDPADAN